LALSSLPSWDLIRFCGGGERGGKRFQFGYHSSSIPLLQKVASFAIDMFWYFEKFQKGYQKLGIYADFKSGEKVEKCLYPQKGYYPTNFMITCKYGKIAHFPHFLATVKTIKILFKWLPPRRYFDTLFSENSVFL
jgi:hypothetical protein